VRRDNTSGEEKLQLRDEKREYFWGEVRLPRAVVAGRLVGRWRVVYVLDGEFS